MNYANIVAAVLAWANKPEIEQAIPTLLTLVDADLKRRLSEAGVAGGQGRDTATLTTGDEYSTAPSDLGRVVRMILTDGGQPIESLSQTGFEAVRAAAPGSVGKPRYFTLTGTAFRYWPVPDADYAVELTYQQRLPALNSSNTTNWVSIHHADVYIHGALWQAAIYLQDDAAAARHVALYEAALASLVQAERGKRGSPRAAGYRADVPLGR